LVAAQLTSRIGGDHLFAAQAKAEISMWPLWAYFVEKLFLDCGLNY